MRSVIARAAKVATGAGVHKDRRLPRGGTKNLSRDAVDEYYQEAEMKDCRECVFFLDFADRGECIANNWTIVHKPYDGHQCVVFQPSPRRLLERIEELEKKVK